MTLSAAEEAQLRQLLGQVRTSSWVGTPLQGGIPQATVRTVLPTAAKEMAGQILRIAGVSGVADHAWICLKDAADAYNWVPLDTAAGAGLTAIDFLTGTATGLLSGEIVVGTTPGGELGNTWASPTVDATHSGSAHSSLAPVGADYLVGTANGTLTSEIVVGTSPGGELGGTWASPTVDTTHSGSAHVAHDYAQDDAGGSTTMTTAGTTYDATTCTITLAAGTWLVWAVWSLSDAGLAAVNFSATIRDSSNNVLYTYPASINQTVIGVPANSFMETVLVLAGTLTLKPSAVSGHNGSTFNIASIGAVRLTA